MAKLTKLEKAIKKANDEIKQKGYFKTHHITMDGIFINLSNDTETRHFPIGDAKNEDMAIAIIKAYLVGLTHSKSSFIKLCDED